MELSLVRALENLPNICLFITEPMSEFCKLYLLLFKICKAFLALLLPCFKLSFYYKLNELDSHSPYCIINSLCDNL